MMYKKLVISVLFFSSFCFAVNGNILLQETTKSPVKKENNVLKISDIYDALEKKISELEKRYAKECAPEEIAYAKTYLETAKGIRIGRTVAKVSKFERYRLLKEAKLKLALAESKINADLDNDGVPCHLEIVKGTDPYKPDNYKKKTDLKKEKKEVVKEEKKVVVKPATFRPLKLKARIHFDFDKAEIKKDYLPYLNVITRYLKRHPELKIKIVGYTDSIGSKKYNDRLALKRAKVVKEYLVKQGISESRIEIEGIGKDKYLFDNKTALNRFTNRRAEFFIMQVK